MREYTVREALQQYRDYYETDAEEQSFFEFMEGLSNRDKLRFAEVFHDPTTADVGVKQHVMIRKREHNPELSVFSNFVLDLVDFKDRVRPLARDAALLDAATKYQKHSMREIEQERSQLISTIQKMKAGEKPAVEESGYSSLELEEPKKK